MTRIFDFSNYKKYVRSWIESQPQKGYGQSSKIADALGISAVLVSQIFKGEKNLSLEHAFLLTEYLGLSSSERDYFLLLVNFEKAGSQKLRDHFHQQIKRIQKEKTESLKEVVQQDITLSEADKAVFYSNWLYSAIRLLTAIRGFQAPEQIANKLGLQREETLEMLRFLVAKGLCAETPQGYRMGPQRTHLEAGSPYVKSRQISWRVKSFEKMDSKNPSNLFYTGPMSISEEQYKELRKKIMALISDFTQNLITDPPEKIACLNIDLFEI